MYPPNDTPAVVRLTSLTLLLQGVAIYDIYLTYSYQNVISQLILNFIGS